MNLPNSITVARIALVPVFLTLAYRDSRQAALAALAVFVVASASDQIDGYLARRWNQITRFGQFLDPLADKLLVGAALVTLVSQRSFPLWAAVVIGVREMAVQVLRIKVVSRGLDLPASPAAKAKTFLQLIMVSWWLVPWSNTNVGHQVVLAVALIATVWSGVEYFVAAGRAREVAV